MKSRLNIGILGANGFVGRNLAQTFSSKNWTVKAYKRSEVDIVNLESLKTIGEHDCLVNCAGYLGLDKDRLFSVNTLGVINLCEEINSRKNRPHIFHISTGGVYGYSDTPILETSIAKPEGNYALSKYLGDEIIRMKYAGAHTVCRLFFPYGIGQSKERLIPRILNNVLTGKPIDVSSYAARPLLNPIYIDDLCEQLVESIQKREMGIRLYGGVEILTVEDIANIAGELTNIRPKFNKFEGHRFNMYCHGRGLVSLKMGLQALIKKDKEHT